MLADPVSGMNPMHESQSPIPPRTVSVSDGRLRKHADYQRVYKATRKQFSASMSWFVAPRPADAPRSRWIVPVVSGPRVGLTVGKVLGKAHERNRIKRRMREIVRKHLGELPKDVDLILHPRRFVMTMDFGKLDAEILRIFRQARAQMASQGASKSRAAEVSMPSNFAVVPQRTAL
jgi:ribonuclease P protein component